MAQRLIISTHFECELATAISECNHDQVFVLVDETTKTSCWESINAFFCLKGARLITIAATDEHKTLEAVVGVWEALQQGNATRHSLMINIGGGMVTDLGGFAASTFKRGINFINVPTTLLAMIDASVGGKTGINFGGYKNEIGVFSEAKYVIIDTCWLKTLDKENLLSGYAEMIKHGLLANDTMWNELVTMDFEALDLEKLKKMIAQNLKVKERIVTKDPLEQGIRKALNLGHTFGHAFEAWALRRKPILHGVAVAYGMVCELYLSVVKKGFPTDKMRITVNFIKANYGVLGITCNDYDELIDLMKHDKKNRFGNINVSLLSNIGEANINQTISEDEAKEALDFFREGYA